MSTTRISSRYNGATAAAAARRHAGTPDDRPGEPPGRGSLEVAIPMRKKKSPVKDLLLTRYAPIADGIAALFFPYA